MKTTDLMDPAIIAALKEDIGGKDATTTALIAPSVHVKADIEFKQDGILCGLEIAERVFGIVDESVHFLPVLKDGAEVQKGQEIAYIEGSARGILFAERVALNFLGRLSGIATRTREFVDKVKGTRARILDTRKTSPNLRLFERYAVRVGGGTNHRFGLFDQILIKDNHLRILRKEALVDIVARARKGALKNTVIGLEVKNLAEFREALKSDADYILLDNMSLSVVEQAVDLRRRANSKQELEVSGGITLENVRDYAETGVERISVGAITHSAPSVDVSLNIVG
jgi:nicotinate-nucleotide pyrophosphorylase (carboxylating)